MKQARWKDKGTVFWPLWCGHDLAGQPAYTEVYYTGDDPTHRPFIKHDFPMLTDKEVEHMNAPFRSHFRNRLAMMTSYDFTFFGTALDLAVAARKKAGMNPIGFDVVNPW